MCKFLLSAQAARAFRDVAAGKRPDLTNMPVLPKHGNDKMLFSPFHAKAPVKNVNLPVREREDQTDPPLLGATAAKSQEADFTVVKNRRERRRERSECQGTKRRAPSPAQGDSARHQPVKRGVDPGGPGVRQPAARARRQPEPSAAQSSTPTGQHRAGSPPSLPVRRKTDAEMCQERVEAYHRYGAATPGPFQQGVLRGLNAAQKKAANTSPDRSRSRGPTASRRTLHSATSALGTLSLRRDVSPQFPTAAKMHWWRDHENRDKSNDQPCIVMSGPLYSYRLGCTTGEMDFTNGISEYFGRCELEGLGRTSRVFWTGPSLPVSAGVLSFYPKATAFLCLQQTPQVPAGALHFEEDPTGIPSLRITGDRGESIGSFRPLSNPWAPKVKKESPMQM